jgi:hypothetical protein
MDIHPQIERLGAEVVLHPGLASLQLGPYTRLSDSFLGKFPLM